MKSKSQNLALISAETLRLDLEKFLDLENPVTKEKIVALNEKIGFYLRDLVEQYLEIEQ